MTDATKPMTLFVFIRERIVPINAVIALSATLALVLDFLAPKAPYLAWVSYILCGFVLACMALELIAPEKLNTWLQTPAQGLGKQFQRLWMGRRPVWSSPAWQALALVAVVATVIGAASKARAYEGGLLASTFPAVKNYQASFASLQDAIDQLNQKIDGAQLGIKDAAEALSRGDFQALQRFLNKGESLPNANATNEYALAIGLLAKKPQRLELLSLYVKDGFDINQSGVIGPLASFPKANSDKLDTWSIKQKGNGNANTGHVVAFGGGISRDADNIFMLSCVELTLLEVAIINNDKEATEWLIKNGADKTTKRKCKSMHGRNKRDISAEVVANILGKAI